MTDTNLTNLPVGSKVETTSGAEATVVPTSALGFSLPANTVGVSIAPSNFVGIPYKSYLYPVEIAKVLEVATPEPIRPPLVDEPSLTRDQLIAEFNIAAARLAADLEAQVEFDYIDANGDREFKLVTPKGVFTGPRGTLITGKNIDEDTRSYRVDRIQGMIYLDTV